MPWKDKARKRAAERERRRKGRSESELQAQREANSRYQASEKGRATRKRLRAQSEMKRRRREYENKYRSDEAVRIARNAREAASRKLNEEWQVRQRDRAHQRRTQEATATGITKPEWTEIKEWFGHRCAYCLKPETLTMDHVTALKRGGAHEAANIVPACRSCNSRKQARGILAMVNG